MIEIETTGGIDTGKPTVEAIQGAILRRICFLDYPPGCQLKEAALAQEFGVSRTPVRDAISRIKHLGLVETRNGVGTVVVTLTRDHIAQVYEMRLHLASMIGTMPPRPVNPSTLARVSDLLDQAKDLETDFDARVYVELNDRLHNLIADLIDNTLLKSFWRQAYFQAASTWYQVAAHLDKGAAVALALELREMKEALIQGDMAAVGFVQRVHIGYGYRRIVRYWSQDDGDLAEQPR